MNRRRFLRESLLAAAGISLAAANFSPAQVSAKPRKIIIIGAGLAGLAAGYELAKAGHEVKILEAQSRVGGRILTVRDFPENLYADVGAGRIPREHELTHKYVRLFDLPLTPFYPAAQKFSVLENASAGRNSARRQASSPNSNAGIAGRKLRAATIFCLALLPKN